MKQEGYAISVYDIPKSFYSWLEKKEEAHKHWGSPVVTIESHHGTIVLVRIKTPVSGVNGIEDIPFGELTKSATGCSLVEKLRPRLDNDGNIIIVG